MIDPVTRTLKVGVRVFGVSIPTDATFKPAPDGLHVEVATLSGKKSGALSWADAEALMHTLSAILSDRRRVG